jgi:hypothetical protein
VNDNIPEGNGFPAYGNCPVVEFCIPNNELREFSMLMTSLVDVTIPGTAIAMSAAN